MADDVRSQTYLFKRGTRYYFRARIPDELVPILNEGREVKFSLKTTDRDEAIRLVREEAVRFDRRLRNARKQIRSATAPTPTVEPAPAACHFSSDADRMSFVEFYGAIRPLQLDDQHRASKPSRLAHDEYMSEKSEERDEILGGLPFGRTPGYLVKELRGCLKEAGYAVDQTSDEFRRLAFDFMVARRKALEIIGKRDRGEDYPETPRAANGTSSVAQGINGPRLTVAVVMEDFLKRQDQKTAMYRTLRRAVGKFRERIIDAKRIVFADELKQQMVVEFFDLLVSQDNVAPKTFKDSYLAGIRPFLKHARLHFADQGWPAALTVEGIVYRGDREAGEEKQRALTADELRKLFEGSAFKKLAADPSQAHRYWLPLVGLYTGARINEVCQLNPQADIVEVDGVWCFNFTPEGETDERVHRRLKNKASRRIVPIHSELVCLGFLKYVEAVKAAGAQLLFPQFSPKGGKASGKAEEWFREFIAEVGLRDETPGKTVKGFHVFRFTFKTAAANLPGSPSVSSLTGHATEGMTSVERGYVSGISVENKRALLERITFALTIPKHKQRP
jgi:integrase